MHSRCSTWSIWAPWATNSSLTYSTSHYSRPKLSWSVSQPPSSQLPRLANHATLGHHTTLSPSFDQAPKSLNAFFHRRFRDVLRICQHGFRKVRSTTSVLLLLLQQLAARFNQKKLPLRTATMAIDLAKAFHTVNHTKLIEAICATGLHHNMIHWLSAYLKGRIAFFIYKDAASTCHAVQPASLRDRWSHPYFSTFSCQITRLNANYSLHTLTNHTQRSHLQISTQLLKLSPLTSRRWGHEQRERDFKSSVQIQRHPLHLRYPSISLSSHCHLLWSQTATETSPQTIGCDVWPTLYLPRPR